MGKANRKNKRKGGKVWGKIRQRQMDSRSTPKDPKTFEELFGY